MTSDELLPTTGDRRVCVRCWRVFEFSAHRRRVVAQRGWTAPKYCKTCAAWRRLPRAARQIDLLESAFPQLLLAGHPLSLLVAKALETPTLQRRACVEVHRWEVREAREA